SVSIPKALLPTQLEAFRRHSLHVIVPGGSSCKYHLARANTILAPLAIDAEASIMGSVGRLLVTGIFSAQLEQFQGGYRTNIDVFAHWSRQNAPDLASTCSLSESTEMAVSAPGHGLPSPAHPARASWVFDSPRFRRFQPTKWCAMHRAKIERIRLARVKREADERAARRMSPRFVEDDSPYASPSVHPGRRSVILRSREKWLAGRRPHFRRGRFENVKRSAAAAVRRPVERELARPALRIAAGSDRGARTNRGGSIALSPRQGGSGTHGERGGPFQVNPSTASTLVHDGNNVKNLARNSPRPAVSMTRRSGRPERAKPPGTCRI
ncbi:hypothetical protein FOZ62_001783, partial [Perkinsus olseni]